MFSIYLIENKQDHKRYVGMTSRSVSTRFKEHCGNRNTFISKQIKKFSSDKFLTKPIACLEDRKSAMLKELECIVAFKSFYPHGYNIKCEGKLAEYLLACSSSQLSFDY